MRQRGFTLVDISLSGLAVLMLGTGFVTLCVAAARSYTHTAGRDITQMPLAQSMAHIARDLQEAKTATVVSTFQLTITQPTTNADGSYNRNVLDTANSIKWFRASASNTPSASGARLCRQVGTGAVMVIMRNVSGVTFSADQAGSISVTLAATDTTSGATYSISRRAAFMRNF